MADTGENRVKELYGDVPLTSGPVDPDNPTFDSLLGALEAVHKGLQPMNTLSAYHRGLSSQLTAQKAAMEEHKKNQGDNEAAASQVQMAIAALDMVQMTLDSLERYIAAPSQEQMAETLHLLLQSMGHVRNMHAMLDGAAQ
ncbi:MAG: hypothetical protein AB2L14_20440 [Candidatus Xenobiia bacterium LiM19]